MSVAERGVWKIRHHQHRRVASPTRPAPVRSRDRRRGDVVDRLGRAPRGVTNATTVSRRREPERARPSGRGRARPTRSPAARGRGGCAAPSTMSRRGSRACAAAAAPPWNSPSTSAHQRPAKRSGRTSPAPGGGARSRAVRRRARWAKRASGEGAVVRARARTRSRASSKPCAWASRSTRSSSGTGAPRRVSYQVWRSSAAGPHSAGVHARRGALLPERFTPVGDAEEVRRSAGARSATSPTRGSVASSAISRAKPSGERSRARHHAVSASAFRDSRARRAMVAAARTASAEGATRGAARASDWREPGALHHGGAVVVGQEGGEVEEDVVEAGASGTATGGSTEGPRRSTGSVARDVVGACARGSRRYRGRETRPAPPCSLGLAALARCAPRAHAPSPPMSPRPRASELPARPRAGRRGISGRAGRTGAPSSRLPRDGQPLRRAAPGGVGAHLRHRADGPPHLDQDDAARRPSGST